MAEYLPVPVVDPGPGFGEVIVQLGLTHSKVDFAFSVDDHHASAP